MLQENALSPQTVTMLLQPGDKEIVLPRPKSVLQLLGRLGLRRGTVLVIRDGVLLTPDLTIRPGDHIILRRVTSHG